MEDVKSKIRYIYYETDGIYYFLSNKGISDHAKRCVLRRFFVLLDSYLEFIAFFKNELFRNQEIDLSTRRTLETEIQHIRSEWDANYEIIRNKLSAHHQEIDDVMLIEWWNEIDYSTITFFYESMSSIRLILTDKELLTTVTPTDYEDIDFSNTCLQETDSSSYYVTHDRLGLAKKNTVSLVSTNDFQRKCMLILSIVDFLFIDFAITCKTQSYKTNYKEILFDTAWLLVVCDTVSLIDNMYNDSNYGDSLLNVCPADWKGKSIIEQSNLNREYDFEDRLKNLRNKFAAHIDTDEQLESLSSIFHDFDLERLHGYCFSHIQTFQKACREDIRTNMFTQRDQKIHSDIIGLSHSSHTTIDK